MRENRRYYLRPIKEAKHPKQFGFLTVLSKKLEKSRVLRYACLVTEDECYDFSSSSELLLALNNKKLPSVIVMQGLSKYSPLILQGAVELGWRLEEGEDDSLPLVSYHGQDTHCYSMDISFTHYRTKRKSSKVKEKYLLRKRIIDQTLIKEDLGLPLYDESLYEQGDEFAISDAIEHTKEEAFGYYQAFADIRDFYFSLGVRMSYTPASLGMPYWQARDFPCDILLPISKDQERFVRRGTYGARAQKFEDYVNGELSLPDVNGMYPTQYRKSLPKGNPVFMEPTIEEFLGGDRHAVVEAKVRTDAKDGLGILPRRTKGEGLHFPPNKTWTAVFNSLELRRAVKEDKAVILDIKRVLEWQDSDTLLKEFAEDTEKVMSGIKNPIVRRVFKDMRTYLYGKLGYRPEQEELHFGSIPEDLKDKVIVMEDSGGPSDLDNWAEESVPRWIRRVERRKGYQLPHISEFVRAYARLHLYDLMVYFVGQGRRLCMCNNDEVMVTGPPPYELMGARDGQLKLKGHGYEAIILSPVNYIVIGDEYKVVSQLVETDHYSREDLIDMFTLALSNPTALRDVRPETRVDMAHLTFEKRQVVKTLRKVKDACTIYYNSN